ncbi:MAG: hypothetical protein GY774_33275 [Planctomycetes bacterium]|nr:hypothetical protein [Planctomycetota bacterium]
MCKKQVGGELEIVASWKIVTIPTADGQCTLCNVVRRPMQAPILSDAVACQKCHCDR